MIHCKRYALFVWEKHAVASGGYELADLFDSVADACAQYPAPHHSHSRQGHVFDLLTRQVVAERHSDAATWTLV